MNRWHLQLGSVSGSALKPSSAVEAARLELRSLKGGAILSQNAAIIGLESPAVVQPQRGTLKIKD